MTIELGKEEAEAHKRARAYAMAVKRQLAYLARRKARGECSWGGCTQKAKGYCAVHLAHRTQRQRERREARRNGS